MGYNSRHCIITEVEIVSCEHSRRRTDAFNLMFKMNILLPYETLYLKTFKIYGLSVYFIFVGL